MLQSVDLKLAGMNHCESPRRDQKIDDRQTPVNEYMARFAIRNCLNMVHLHLMNILEYDYTQSYLRYEVCDLKSLNNRGNNFFLPLCREIYLN